MKFNLKWVNWIGALAALVSKKKESVLADFSRCRRERPLFGMTN